MYDKKMVSSFGMGSEENILMLYASSSVCDVLLTQECAMRKPVG